jgi:hypothetical protein
MSRRPNPPLPHHSFGLLIVEGGDERALCEAVAGPGIWSSLFCWTASGRSDLKTLALLARLDPGFIHARSVGLVLDVEEDPREALRLAQETLAVFGHTAPVTHGAMTGQPLRLGAFLAPDGSTPGSIEILCRQAVREPKLASCVDALVQCAQPKFPTTALAAKGWLNAYLAMLSEQQRIHQAFDVLKGGLDASHAAFAPLRGFLHGL